MRRRVGERMISACVVPTVKHGGGGVMVSGCFAGYTVCDIFRIQGTLKPLQSTPSFFEHSVKNRATFQRPATHARNIVYAYD